MGAWGMESCSNDKCWDALLCEDIFECTESEIELSLSQAMDCVDSKYPEEKEIYLGIVIWGLSYKTKVAIEHLKNGLKIAQALVKNKNYLGMWSEPETRKEILKEEIQMIKFALNNNGIPSGSNKEPQGLFEKMLNKKLE